MPITPVGLFPFASCFSLLTSAGVQGSRVGRLDAGLALRGPLRPIGEPGRFHAAFAMMILLQVVLASHSRKSFLSLRFSISVPAQSAKMAACLSQRQKSRSVNLLK